MKSRWIKIVLSLLLVAVIAGGAYWQVRFNKDWREQYAYVKGIDAMVYAFPYFLNSVLLYKGSLPSDDPASPSDLGNQFWHAPGVIDPKVYRDGGSPNRDTVYSAAVVYAANEPIVLSVPPIPDERYYTLEIAGFDSDNFAYVGKRTHGNGGGNYAIVPPGWEGELPTDVEYLAENPTPWFLILARILIDPNDPEDEARVKALQAQYSFGLIFKMETTMNTLSKLKAGIAVALILSANSSLAATISGRVATEQNTALAGAIVTLWNEAKDQKLSTYTDEQGQFQLTTDFSGAVTLRGRSPYYRDTNVPLELDADAAVEQLLVLEKMDDAQEISDSLPASAHMTRLDLDEQEERETFISQCNYCHQQGNSLTRRPRDEQAWSDTVWRMEGYGVMVTDSEHDQIVDTLHEGFDGGVVKVEQTHDFSPELARATIHEWHVATPTSFLHDTLIGLNGNLYGIDESDDLIYELDRDTDEIVVHQIPNPQGLPEGGNFEGAQLPIGIFTGHHGPHSGAQISDGRIFFTAALSG